MARPPFVNPDYWALLGGQVPTSASPATDIYAIRNSTNAATQAASNALTYPAGMTETTSTISSTDGTQLNITRFVPLNVQQSGAKAQRAVIYVFGGGLVAGSVSISRNMIANFAQQTATQVFAPDYRLAPEHPYPAAFEDVYSTLTWLQAHADIFNVDPARIVTFGQSAGGNLIAATSLKARDEGLNPPIAAQVFRYPMLDDRTQMDQDNPKFPYLTWRPSANTIVWNAYLSGLNELGSTAKVPFYAAPGRADDLRGLPPTHLGVGSLDLFLDETANFAERLSSHDVKTQSKVYPGVPHGFDGHPAFTLKTELWDNEVKFIQQF